MVSDAFASNIFFRKIQERGLLRLIEFTIHEMQ
jgi:hypothetical protein